jgi:hypothetical protein
MLTCDNLAHSPNERDDVIGGAVTNAGPINTLLALDDAECHFGMLNVHL